LNGATKYEKHLRELGHRQCNGCLTFAATRSDIPDVYPDLDLAVVPSHTENIPFAAIEALLSGVPVVTTNVGGLPDLVQEGVSGRLVSPRNPQAIAAAMVGSLQNRAEARQLTIKGQEMARHLFDVGRNTREIAEIYSSVVARAA
jgi:glycosyltransferase involved in cell wall biosynthesis